MIVGVLGTCDKRVFLYPMIKLLDQSGDVIFITDNNQFKRLIDGADYGYYRNVLIYVTDATPDQIWEKIQFTEEDFDHVIYDIKYQIPDTVDKFIYLYTIEMRDDEKEILELIDEYATVKLVYGKPDKAVKKSGEYISLTLRDAYSLEYAEVVGLPSYVNPSLLGKLYELTNDFLKIPKVHYKNIMKEEWK